MSLRPFPEGIRKYAGPPGQTWSHNTGLTKLPLENSPALLIALTQAADLLVREHGYKVDARPDAADGPADRPRACWAALMAKAASPHL